MHMERLLTKHMARLLQRSRSTAKPRRSRRGDIPRDPEGDCEGCCNPGSTESCWAPKHLEGELILKGNRIQGEDLFSKLLFICIICKTCIWCILMGCRCCKENMEVRITSMVWGLFVLQIKLVLPQGSDLLRVSSKPHKGKSFYIRFLGLRASLPNSKKTTETLVNYGSCNLFGQSCW